MQKIKKINDWEVLTPSGFQSFDGILTTEQQEIYEYKKLRGTSTHKIFDNNEFKEFKDIAKPLGYKEDVYDLLNVANGNLYYTDDLISHNCQFLGGANCLFTPSTLQKLSFKYPMRVIMDQNCDVYEDVIQGHNYCCSVDVGEGVGRDYSVINVIDCTEPPLKQVAVYRSNQIELTLLPWIIEGLAKMYNHALVVIENNAAGKLVTNKLFYDIEYEHTYADNKEVGIRMTTPRKKQGCAVLREMIENDVLIISSFECIKEMSNFVRKGTSFAAAPGNTDDIVMSLVLFSYFTKSEFYKEWCNRPDDYVRRLYDEKIRNVVEHDFLPIIGINGDEERVVSHFNKDEDGVGGGWKAVKL